MERSTDPFAVAATHRQLARYPAWLVRLKGSLLGKIGPVAGEMLKLLEP